MKLPFLVLMFGLSLFTLPALAMEGVTSDEISTAQLLKLRNENIDISLNKDDTINLFDHINAAQNGNVHVLGISDISNLSDGLIWKIVFVNCSTKQFLLFEHAKYNPDNMQWIHSRRSFD